MVIVEKADGRALLQNFQSFLFDADGVIWLGDKPIDGAPQFLLYLVNQGKNVFITTNNSTKTLNDYVKKCKELGFTMVPDDHILSPAKVLAAKLAKENSNLPVYLVGSDGLKRELESMGVQSFGCGPDHTETYTTTDFIHQIDTSKQVRAVITSYDVHLSYPKVMKAANYIKQGAHFYATNEDATLPGPVPGVIIPGAGIAVQAVKVAAGKAPEVIGKPGRAMFEYVQDKFGVEANTSVMFGDRCDTDIKFGHTNGMKSILVGTGVHQLDAVNTFMKEGRTDLVPTWYIPSLKVLYDQLQ